MLRNLRKKSKAMDGLLVTIGIILLAMILILAFKDTIVPSVKNALSGVSTEIDALSNWSEESNP